MNFRPAPPIVPVELVGLNFRCDSCAKDSEIEWSEVLAFPREPIAPNEGGGFWVPVSFPQVCTCGSTTHVRVPRSKTTQAWNLYGDEAAREFQNGFPGQPDARAYFFSITLVGFSGNLAGGIRGRLRGLKRRAKRGIDPDTWALHATEIFSDTKNANGISLRGAAEKAAWFQDVCALIREAQPNRVLHNISGMAIETSELDWRSLVNHVKEELYQIAILTNLHQFVEKGYRPIWHFERTRVADEGENWANRAFQGLRHMPLFTWLSAGNAIHPPNFLSKGQHPYLELADFASFVIAREFYRRATGRPVEIPSSSLGMGFYQALNARGGVEREWSEGLPERFYPF